MNGSHQHWTKIMLIWKLDVRNILQPQLNRRHPGDDTFLKESFIFLFKFHWSLFLGGPSCQVLTHWGRVAHICVSKLTIIGSDNALSPSRRQAIIWTNAGISLIRNLGTNFSEILSEINTFLFKKIHLKMSSGKWRPFCLGLNVLIIGKQYSGILYFTVPERKFVTKIRVRYHDPRWWRQQPVRMFTPRLYPGSDG